MDSNIGNMHQTWRVAPAMEVGATDHVWLIDEIVCRSERVTMAVKLSMSRHEEGFEVVGNRAGLRNLAEVCLPLSRPSVERRSDGGEGPGRPLRQSRIEKFSRRPSSQDTTD
jgi:hypothetical protein